MLSETEVARDIYQVEEATPSRRARAPKELLLEEIIKNKTASVGCPTTLYRLYQANRCESHVPSPSLWTTSYVGRRTLRSCNFSLGFAVTFPDSATCHHKKCSFRRHGSQHRGAVETGAKVYQRCILTGVEEATDWSRYWISWTGEMQGML